MLSKNIRIQTILHMMYNIYNISHNNTQSIIRAKNTIATNEKQLSHMLELIWAGKAAFLCTTEGQNPLK